MRSTRADRLAGAIVRSYPRRWRARYETELLALLDATPGSFATVIDLAGGMLREWMRALFQPAPVDARMERRRVIVLNLVRPTMFLGASWIVAQPLKSTWIGDLESFWWLWLMAPTVFAMWRAMRISTRGQRVLNDGANSPDIMPQALVAIGASPREYGMWLLFVAVGWAFLFSQVSNGWTLSRLFTFFSFGYSLNKMHGATASALLRRWHIKRLAVTAEARP